MDYSDGYMLVKIPKNLTEQGPNVAVIQDDRNNKQVIFKILHHLLFVQPK